jgi:hypothetical protein
MHSIGKTVEIKDGWNKRNIAQLIHALDTTKNDCNPPAEDLQPLSCLRNAQDWFLYIS